ncbi:MAG: hypothetical protein HC846_03285 [Blastocatellia bacterium]|nr:hypothetical protein [Blastocatellia bacterium]
MQSPDAQKEAHITNFNEILSEPKEIRFGDGKGVYVYIENREIFDKTLPKWQPQFMIVRFRRPDVSPAKTAFNKKVEDEFDFNVVRKMVGLKPMPQTATISNLGSTQGGYTSGKIENATTENSASESADGVLFNENFDDSIIGQAPNKWTVSNNTAIVRNNSGANWLAMKKEGLFFPDYSTLLLPKDFTLEFDLSWNKENFLLQSEFLFSHRGGTL